MEGTRRAAFGALGRQPFMPEALALDTLQFQAAGLGGPITVNKNPNILKQAERAFKHTGT